MQSGNDPSPLVAGKGSGPALPAFAVVGAIASAGSGWLLVAAFCVIGWLSVENVPIAVALHLATQGWLLAHWVPVALPGATMSIAPLGLTMLNVVICASVAGLVQNRVAEHTATQRTSLRRTLGGFVLVYAVTVTLVALFVEGSGAGLRGLAGGLLVGGLGALLGNTRVVGPLVDELLASRGLPVWLPAVGHGLRAGVLLMIAAGASVLTMSLLMHHDRVVALHQGLGPGVLGGVLLLLGQLMWLPNLVLWCTAWVTGAGFGLGSDTIVSPVWNQLGMLPSIPVLGAVPQAGPATQWALLWLLVPLSAGVTSAAVVVRAQLAADPLPAAGLVIRPDLTAVTGTLAAMAAGLCVVVVVLVSGGDLGTQRLIGMGARMPHLLIMTLTEMGLAGMVTGAVLGIRHWRRHRAGSPAG